MDGTRRPRSCWSPLRPHRPALNAPGALLLALAAGCGTERPAPCVANSCGTVMDRDVVTFFPELPDVAADVSPPGDRPDAASPPMDAAAPDVVASDAPADIADDIPQDPPRTAPRADLGTRGLIASLPCSDVLRYLEVEVTPRAQPPNSFRLQVRNASPTDTLSVWYDATLNTEWNIESLASDLAPGATVSLDFWRVSGSPAWYVLGINKLDHYYVNRDGIFVELGCGRAARQATQRFRATIPP